MRKKLEELQLLQPTRQINSSNLHQITINAPYSKNNLNKIPFKKYPLQRPSKYLPKQLPNIIHLQNNMHSYTQDISIQNKTKYQFSPSSKDKLKQKNVKQSLKSTQLVNQLLQIMKNTNNDANSSKKINLSKKKNIYLTTEAYQYHNQFNQIINKTTTSKNCNKVKPKILQNQISLLGNHNNIIKRKLYSQEKYRFNNNRYQQKTNKQEPNIGILTFYSKIPLKKIKNDPLFQSQFVFQQ